MKFRFTPFLFKQSLALFTAVLSGWMSGQVLSLLPGILLGRVEPTALAQYGSWVSAAFWLIPCLISLCVSVLLSLTLNRSKKRRVAV